MENCFFYKNNTNKRAEPCGLRLFHLIYYCPFNYLKGRTIRLRLYRE